LKNYFAFFKNRE